jgi:hypothetical protein
VAKNPREARCATISASSCRAWAGGQARAEFGRHAADRFAQPYINLAALYLRQGQPEKARPLLATVSRFPSTGEAETIARLQRELP